MGKRKEERLKERRDMGDKRWETAFLFFHQDRDSFLLSTEPHLLVKSTWDSMYCAGTIIIC